MNYRAVVWGVVGLGSLAASLILDKKKRDEHRRRRSPEQDRMALAHQIAQYQEARERDAAYGARLARALEMIDAKPTSTPSR